MKLIVAIAGASGAIYGIRLLEILKEISSVETHLIISKSANITINSETKYKISKTLKDLYAKGYKSKGVITQESREKALLWHLSDLNTIKKQVLK